MGLGDELDKLAEEDADNSSSSTSKSSSSSSSSSKSETLIPYLAIWREEDGTFHSGYRPENIVIEREKKQKDNDEDRWTREIKAIPAELERFWMDKLEVRRAEKMVEEELGKDLKPLIEDDPEAALKAIREAAKSESPKHRPSRTRPCAVCGKDLDYIGGDYEQVNGKRVCSTHTVQDMAEAGLLE